MAVIKCKMCGGDMEISADKTFGTCEYCGSTMTLPKVSDDQRAAAFNRGNHFRRAGEFDKALGVYERIVAEDDTDAEAHWCCALCRFGIEYVEDPATYEWLPTCHRASFDSFLEDVDYLAALEHSDGITRRQYQKDAAKIAEVQRGILATSQNTEPYDVFISYKELDENGERTRDSVLAQDIYYQLTEQGRRVFFSRISLEDIPGTQYEPYIFAALNSAKVMIVVGTSAENLNAVWVKNEWSRFLAMMRKDKSKLLIPCYRDMDPYDMPEQLTVLMSYDMGKIGFIQDLIRGVNKVLDADKPKEKETVHETVVVKNEGGANAQALLKRGNMALEDGDWKRADEFFEQVLNQNAECAEAYLGKFLVENKCMSTDEYADKRIDALRSCSTERQTACEVQEERIRKAKQENALPGYLEEAEIERLFDFDRSYDSCKKARSEQLQSEKDFFAQNREIKRIEKYASPEVSEQLNGMKNKVFSFLRDAIAKAENEDKTNAARVVSEYNAHLEKAEAEAKSLRADAERKREIGYSDAGKLESHEEYLLAAAAYEKLNDYKDSKERAAQCLAKHTELERALAETREKEALELAERRRKEAEAAKKKKKKITIFASTAAVLIIAAIIIVTKVIIPESNYKKAEMLLSSEDYENAIVMFEALGDYKDSAERANEVYALKEKADEDARIAALEKANADAYAEAEALLDAGDKARAAIKFGAIAEYKDAKERSRSLWNEVAQRDTVSAGSSHTLGLKADGTVVAVGDNDSGQCRVGSWKDIVAVSAGNWHTVGLKADGTVVAVGNNHYNQCNVSDWTGIVAVAAGDCNTVGLKSDGTAFAIGANVSDWEDIVAVSAGWYYAVGLKADGTVVAVGDNKHGQCNVSGWKDIVAVSSVSNHTVGLKADGTVVAVGDNKYGQCNVSNWTDIVAVSAGGDHTVGLKADGTVVAVGDNKYGQCNVSNWTDIVAVSAGGDHTVGLKADGTVVATEYTGYYFDCGQCDVDGWTDIKVPER